MIERVRRYFRDESVGIAVPVGFVLLYALWNLLISIVGGVFYPFVLHLAKGDAQDAYRLDFHVGHVLVDVSTPFTYAVAFLLLVPVVYFVFVRGNDPDGDASFEMRECPACKSDVFSDATRCAFCTSEIEPLSAGGAEEATIHG
jgi:large conductance mechanosensitive channel